MALRFVCDIEGLEHNWVEVAEVWTRREVRELSGTKGDDLITWLHNKITDCYIVRSDGTICTNPLEIDDDLLDDVDLRLVDFIATVLIQAVGHLRSLGNLSGRLSSNGAGPSKTTTA